MSLNQMEMTALQQNDESFLLSLPRNLKQFRFQQQRTSDVKQQHSRVNCTDGRVNAEYNTIQLHPEIDALYQ